MNTHIVTMSWSETADCLAASDGKRCRVREETPHRATGSVDLGHRHCPTTGGAGGMARGNVISKQSCLDI